MKDEYEPFAFDETRKTRNAKRHEEQPHDLPTVQRPAGRARVGSAQVEGNANDSADAQ